MSILSDPKTLMINQAKIDLRNSEWTQLPDSGLSVLKRLEWQGYRDELRDIHANLKDDSVLVENVIYPLQPAEE